MTDWLLDTLLWTAGLIALVLVLRRPVGRMFGPHVAYALWAIPAIRLVLPPIELPAWLNPAPEPVAASATVASSQATDSEFLFVQPQNPAATMDRLDAATGSLIPSTPLPLLEIGISVWLAGAALFLFLRFSAYFRLRADLLRDAREVGRYGNIRMVETPEANAPLAFGVLDPVIALPSGFMAQPDRTARDLALAHELSHHNARDLLANMIVQPLFALHWFNPLGRYGWLAMRRDQEAACDARVIAAKPAEERAVYASLIASFAAGPKFSLAAPMACPVLGEKSIVHRLRSLKMSDMSSRRRMAGRLFVGAGLLALPLTASISYAESAAAPEPPAPPSVASVAPAVPSAPAAPTPPIAPAPPTPPAAPIMAEAIVSVDPDVKVESEVDVIVTVDDDARADGQKKRKVKKVKKYSVHRDGKPLSDEEREEIMREVRESLAEADEAIAESRVEIRHALAEAGQMRTEVIMKCRSDSDEVAEVEEGQNGQQTVYLCQARVMAHALEGLKEARSAISENREIEGKMRKQLLETLDEQISTWEKEYQS